MKQTRIGSKWMIYALVIFSIAVPSFVHAQYAPQKLNISGGLFQSNGQPLTGSVDFKLEIWDKNKTCVLYSEEHTSQDLTTTKGGFSLVLGGGSSSVNNIAGGGPALDWQVFANSGVATGAFVGCAGGVTMAAGDERYIRVYYNSGSGLTQMNPDVPLVSSAYAIVAESVQGKTAADLIQVRDDVGTDLTQSNVETVFSATNYAKLLQLLNNTFTAAYSFNNQRVTGVATPTAASDAATKGYADGYIGGYTADMAGVGPAVGDGKTLIWDQAQNKWVTGVPSAIDASKLPLAGGTMSGAISMGGYDIVGAGHVSLIGGKMLQLGTLNNAGEGALVFGAGDAGKIFFNTDTGIVRAWNGSAFTGFAPSGAAGGDLSGTYPNPLVNANAITTVKIANDAVSAAKIDNAGIATNRLVSSDATTGTTLRFVGCGLNEVMQFDAAGKWVCRTVANMLGTTGVSAATYGSATAVSQITVDAQGRVTNALDVPIAIPSTQITQTGAVSGQVLMWNGSAWLPSWELGDITQVDVGIGLTGGGTTANVSIDLANTAVTAGSYGSASQVASFTVDQQGRLTYANNVPIAINPTAINQYGGAAGQVLKWNGSAWLPADDVGAGGFVTNIATGTGLTGGPITSVGTVSLADTAVTAGSYGSASSVANFTVDAQGRLTYANNVAIAIDTTALNQTGAASGQVLKWNGSAWLAAADTDSGGDITDVVAGTGLTGGGTTGAVTVTLTDTAVTAGSYGSASSVATYTVDAQGRLTASSNTSIAIDPTAINQYGGASGQVLKWNGSAWLPADDVGAGGFVTNIATGTGLSGGPITSVGTVSLADTAVTAGSYGLASSVANFTVDAQGRLTFANNTPIAIDTTALNQTGAASGQVLKWNGSAWLAAADTDSGGDITDVVAGTGLTGGGTSGAVTVKLTDTSVTAGSYGSASSVATYTVDAQGRLTASSNTSIAIDPTAINQYSAASGQILKWNGSAWLPADDIGGAGFVTNIATGTGLSGGPITSVGTVSLADTAVTAGSYGSASSVANFTVDAQGRLTYANNVAIAIDTTALNQTGAASGQVLKWNGSAWLAANDTDAGGDITDVVAGTGLTGGGTSGAVTVTLADTAVTAGSYGSASSVATYTVDAQGRLTASSNTSIAIDPTAINQYSAASGQILKWNGSAWLPADDIGGAGFVTNIATGTGLSGGPITSVGTVSLADTAVTAGSYGSASSVANFTVDAQGRLTYANNVAIAIDTTALNQTGAASGQVLKWNGSAWLAANDTDAGGDITDVVAGTGLTGGGTSGAVTVTLTDTAVTAGSYGSASSVATYTVDAQGRLTASSNTSIAIPSTAITQTGAASGQVLKWNGSAWLASDDIGGAGFVTNIATGTGLSGGPITSVGTVSLADTAVTAGSYGSASSVANFTVDAQGRLSFANNTPIAIDTTALNQTGAASGQVLKWNGSAWLAANDTDAGGDITDVVAGTGLTGGGTSGAVTVTLTDTAVTAGSYGSASSVATYTVDAQGRLTASSNTSIAIDPTAINQYGGVSGQVLKWNGSAWLPADDIGGAGFVTNIATGTGLSGGPITSVGTVSLADTAVTAGSYGSASSVANFTVDAQGRLTFANNTPIAIDTTALNQTGAASGQVLKWNGSAWLAANDTDAGGDITDVVAGTGLTGGGTSGAVTVTLTDTAVTAGSYGSASSVATYTVDAQGRLTASSNTSIAIDPTAINQYSAASGQILKWNGSAWLPADDIGGAGYVTNIAAGAGLTGGPITSVGTLSLASSGVTAASYGSASSVATFNVDTYGRLTLASNTPIAINTTALNQTGAASGQVLKWNGSAWLAAADTDSGGDITDVVAGTGLTGGGTSGAVTVTLTDTAVTAGSYGSASSVATYTVDAQGRLTASSNTSIAIPSTAITQTGAASGQVLKWNGSAWLASDDIGGAGYVTNIATGTGLTGGPITSVGTLSLASSGVTAASYGSASSVATFNVDTYGRLTLASNTPIAIDTTALNQTGAASGQVLKWNGSAWLAANDTDAGGDITDVVAGTGLTGGGTTGAVTVTLTDTAVTAGSYGSASQVATYTVDAQGRLTASSNTPIAINPTAINQYSAASGQILKWNGSAWLPADDIGGAGFVTNIATGTGLSGGPITSVGTVSLADTAVTAGSYGSASSVANFTVDAQGRLSFANNTPIAVDTTALNQTGAASGQVLKWNGSAWLAANDTDAGGDITDVVAGTGLTGGGTSGAVTVTLGDTAVTAGSYGSASSVANFTVDAQGRLTASSNTSIAIPSTAITQTGAASGQVLKWNGSAWLPASSTAGSVTYIAAGTGLTGGPISSAGTLSVNVGVGSYQIPQYDSGGLLGIGTTSVTAGAALDIWGDTSANSSLLVPRATTASRPTVGINGMIRYNTSLAKFEVYESGNWYNVATGSTGDDLGNHTATTQILSTLGTANAPGYSFSGDTDTGMWNLGSNVLVASTGGTERIRIDATGNIGIGVSPSYLLQARKDQNTSTQAFVQNFNSGASSFSRFGAGSNVASAAVGAYSSGNASTRDGLSLSSAGDLIFTNSTRGFVGTSNSAPLYLVTSDLVRVSVTESGIIGIGTTSPNNAAVLDVNGTGNLSAMIVPRSTTAERPVTAVNGMIRYNTNLAAFEVYQASNWATIATGSGSGDNLGNHTATTQILSTLGTANAPGYSFSGDTDTGIWKVGVGQLGFSTEGVERIRIDSTGRVGIGTAPADVFHVVGDMILEENNPEIRLNDNNGDDVYIKNSGGDLLIRKNDASTANLVILQTGPVGIGTSSPGRPLEIAGTGNQFMRVTSTDANITALELMRTGAGSRDWRVGNSSGGDFYIGSSADDLSTVTPRFYIDSSSYNVGIGTDTPSNRIDVRDTQASNAVAYIYNTNTGASAEGVRVQIDATTPGTSNLFASFRKSGGTVIGSITGDGAGGVQYNLASDRRLKGHIRDTHYSIRDLMKIRVRDYHYLGHNVDTNGFIAQELYEAYAPAVSKPEDETKQYWQVDYGRLTPLIVKSVQDVYGMCAMTSAQQADLAARVASHDREISALKREVQALREKNLELEQKLNRVLNRLDQR